MPSVKGCTSFEKLYYTLAMKVFAKEEFSSKKFYFPLLHGGLKRKVAKAGVEPLKGSSFEVEGRYVIATKGFAFATFLATGYALAILYLPLFHPVTC